MKIQESGENYLETILILENKNGTVRSIDVANELSYTKASVSRAMSILRQAGHLTMERDGRLLLTDSGRAIANRMYERHQMLTEFLITLGVSPDTAAADACRIEHVISGESFDKIKEHAQKAQIKK